MRSEGLRPRFAASRHDSGGNNEIRSAIYRHNGACFCNGACTVCGRRSKDGKQKRRRMSLLLPSSRHLSLPRPSQMLLSRAAMRFSTSRESRGRASRRRPAGARIGRIGRQLPQGRMVPGIFLLASHANVARPTAWATCMAEAPPSHTTSTGISDWWRILAAMPTAG